MDDAADCESQNQNTSARNAGSLFFPLTSLIGVDPDCNMTPSMLEKAVYAGACSSSFVQAEKDLSQLAEASISSQRIRRATERIGNERASLSARAEANYEAMFLPARQLAPKGVAVPEVACVQMDGGRIQVRQRRPTPTQVQAVASKGERTGHWRESKVACLLEMKSEISLHDPTPQLPPTFTDRVKMHQMCSEIKGFASTDEPVKNAEAVPLASADGTAVPESHPPRIITRSVVASLRSSHQFGLQLAAAAYAQGFHAASRKAFICDGQSSNWKVWEQWFSHYTPIVDFIHAICYVFAAAMAGRSNDEGWKLYQQWAQWLWQGDVDRIIEALAAEQRLIGEPSREESTTTRRYNVARTLTYLRNQRERMNYPAYRRQGLPITSSHIESTIKQINRRVKGSEKFWDRAAEAILHLAADHIGSELTLAKFWTARPSTIASYRCQPIEA